MGFFSGLVDSFTGQSAKDAHKQGFDESNKYLNEGETKAAGAVNDSYSKAGGYLDHYQRQGQAANALYGNAVGANGGQAQSDYYRNFQNDPGWEAQQRAGEQAMNRAGNARGGFYGGAQMKGLYNYGMQNQRQAYNDRLQQLAQQGQQGYGAAGAQSQLAAGQGNALSGIYGGFAQQHAGNAINYGNAQAQDSNIFFNNLMGLAAPGIAAATGVPMPKPGSSAGGKAGGYAGNQFGSLGG